MAVHTKERPLDLLRAVLSPGNDLLGLQRLVLVALIIHRNNMTGRCCPSLRRLGACAGIHKTSVRRALQGLEEAGVVVTSSSNGIPNQYSLNLTDLQTQTGSGEPPVVEGHRSRRDHEPVAERTRTGSGAVPELLKNCEETAEREADAPAPAPVPKPPDGLVEIPVSQPGKGKPTPSTWWLTAAIRKKIAAEYPGVDVVAVAEDLARKVRAGARDPYTYRGVRKGLASWVAREAENGVKRSRSVKHAARVERRDWNGEAEARRERMRLSGEAALAAAGVTPEEYAAGVDIEN